VGIAEESGDSEAFEEKMGRLTAELSGLFSEGHKLEKEIKKRLGAIGWEV
jgi:type I restriction enzyme M protein